MTTVQHRNNESILAAGRRPNRPDHRIPSNEVTREFFPQLIGKRTGAFFDHVRQEFRVPIAHLSLDDFDRMVLDPASERLDHRVDAVNAVLLEVIHTMISDEWQLMRNHGIS